MFIEGSRKQHRGACRAATMRRMVKWTWDRSRAPRDSRSNRGHRAWRLRCADRRRLLGRKPRLDERARTLSSPLGHLGSVIVTDGVGGSGVASSSTPRRAGTTVPATGRDVDLGVDVAKPPRRCAADAERIGAFTQPAGGKMPQLLVNA